MEEAVGISGALLKILSSGQQKTVDRITAMRELNLQDRIFDLDDDIVYYQFLMRYDLGLHLLVMKLKVLRKLILLYQLRVDLLLKKHRI